jgi:hypothetical protein
MEYDETRSWDQHKARLIPYLDGQGTAVAKLRASSMPSSPWPAQDNQMLAYLLAHASEMLENGSTSESALVWLAAHAWFEGALDRSADLVDAITTTTRRAQ